MEGLAPGKGSSQEDRQNQEKREKEKKLEDLARNLFENCPEAREIILDRVDLETALACRLVCKEWRETVNGYRKLWAKINKVFSIFKQPLSRQLGAVGQSEYSSEVDSKAS